MLNTRGVRGREERERERKQILKKMVEGANIDRMTFIKIIEQNIDLE